mmetsp:Transcript_35677/g.119260  ORF Transcript_35677/g.119260 Transcript_35677/m.119260 type:complete len:162 (-) Transcript_35677:64-549(-)
MEVPVSTSMEVLHLRVRVLFLPHALVPRHLHALLRILFFSRPVGERFCQCSVAVDGVSLIGSSDELECLLAREGVLVDPNEWAVVRVCEGQSGFESVGVIERITGPLAAAAVPVLYVTTFADDFVLIPASRVADAAACLGAASWRWSASSSPRSGLSPARE